MAENTRGPLHTQNAPKKNREGRALEEDGDSSTPSKRASVRRSLPVLIDPDELTDLSARQEE